jgi:hypothetical protein
LPPLHLRKRNIEEKIKEFFLPGKEEGSNKFKNIGTVLVEIVWRPGELYSGWREWVVYGCRIKLETFVIILLPTMCDCVIRYLSEGRFVGKDQSMMATTCLETAVCLLLSGTSTQWFRNRGSPALPCGYSWAFSLISVMNDIELSLISEPPISD